MQKTLKTLREESYYKADLKIDSAAIPSDLANLFVNEAWAELYDLIISMDDGRVFAVNATEPPALGDYSFSLPYDFYHMCSVHVLRNGTYIPAIAADNARYAELADNTYDWAPPQYFIREDPGTGQEFLFLFPATVSESVALTYFPEPPYLSKDSDELSNKASRLEYVTLGAAIRMLSKIERDPATLIAQQAAVAQRVMTSVTNMDFNNPRRIRDINYRFGNYGG